MAAKSKRTPKRTGKSPRAKAPVRPRPPAPTQRSRDDDARRQILVREIVALVASPAWGLPVETAERVARRVVRDHPQAFAGELVPIVIAQLERELLEAA